jgi:hypothetical protein
MTMNTRFITGALIASVAAGALAAPTFASAQPYGYYDDCRAHERSNGTAGTIIGGIAGALLGSSVAPHHGNRAGGAAIGGVAGALIGNSIGRSSAKSNSYACNGGYDHRYYSYDNRGYYSGYSAPTYYYNGGDDGRYSYNSYNRSNRYNSYNGYYSQPYSYESRSYYSQPYSYESRSYYDPD